MEEKVVIPRGEFNYIMDILAEYVQQEEQKAQKFEAEHHRQNAEVCRDYATRYGAYLDQFIALFGSTKGDIAVVPADQVK